MRTLMIVNDVPTDGVFDAVGSFNIFKNGFENPDATGYGTPAGFFPFAKGDVLTAVNSLVAGKTALTNSYRKFDINPFNFSSKLIRSGSDVADFSTITYPSGNYSLDEPCVGGIVIRKHDRNNNVFKTLKIVEFEIATVKGTTTWATIQAAIVVKLDAMTDYLTKVSVTKYTHVLADTTLEFVGSLNVLRSVKTFGGKEAITGVELAKMEEEFAPNSGGNNTIDRNESYLPANFIVDASKEYDLIDLVTAFDSERPLLPNSGGFETTLVMAFPRSSGNNANATAVKAFLDAVQADPTGLLSTEIEMAAAIDAIP